MYKKQFLYPDPGCRTSGTKGEKININTATKAQLISLKYVGEKLADRIIAHRKETPFKTPEDIMKVKGIGPKVLKENKDRITTEDT